MLKREEHCRMKESHAPILGGQCLLAMALLHPANRLSRDANDETPPSHCRPDTFSLGVCNGCQLMALLGWIPGGSLQDVEQPRFVHNASGRFECRWSTVEIRPSPSILLKASLHYIHMSRTVFLRSCIHVISTLALNHYCSSVACA